MVVQKYFFVALGKRLAGHFLMIALRLISL